MTSTPAHSVDGSSIDNGIHERIDGVSASSLTDDRRMRRENVDQSRRKRHRLQDDRRRESPPEIASSARAVPSRAARGLSDDCQQNAARPKTMAAMADAAAESRQRPEKKQHERRTARPARGRSRGRRRAPVVALVVVPVIARVVILVPVEVDAVQHHANRSRLSGAQRRRARVRHGPVASSRSRRRRRLPRRCRRGRPHR